MDRSTSSGYQLDSIQAGGTYGGEEYLRCRLGFIRSEASGVYGYDTARLTKYLIFPSHAEPACIMNFQVIDTSRLFAFGDFRTCLHLHTFSPDWQPTHDGASSSVTILDGFGPYLHASYGQGWEPWDSFDTLKYARVCGIEYGVRPVLATDDAPAPSLMRLEQSYPNPVLLSSGGRCEAGFTLEQTSYVSLHLSTLLGQQAEVIFEGDLPPGRHVIPIPVRSLHPGRFVISLRTSTGVRSRIMTVE